LSVLVYPCGQLSKGYRPPAWSVALLGLLLLSGGVLAAPAPKVVVSSRPLHSITAGLMQAVAEPLLVIDEPVAPWDYEPTAADRAELAGADIVIWSGTELEPAFARLLDGKGANALVFEVLASDALKVLPAADSEDRRDPFFWLDSRNMLIVLDGIARLLVEADPERAPVYERNWQRMAASIGEVDRTLEFGYRDVSGVPVFFYHDSHRYFQQAYAMHVAGSVMPAGAGQTVDAGRLLEVRGRMSQAGRTCLFTEKGIDEPHLATILAGTQIEPVELDSFGVGLDPGPDLYVKLMRGNFATIAACIRETRPLTAGPVAPDPDVPDVRNFPDRITPRYLMRDQYGRTVSNRDFGGRFQLINFGYTYCPDVCPTSLAIMSQTMTLLGDDAVRVQPIFITVDPERDRPEVLKEYLAYFDDSMLGLSASPEVTKRTAELFKARFERVPAEDGDPRRYTMDHTASLYLLGRRGEYITKFAHGLPAREVSARIREFMDE